MKTQMNNSIRKTAYHFVWIWILLMNVACTDQKGYSQEKNSNSTGIKAPKVDIHTAIITDNLEAVTQHIKAGTDLNAKDPMGGSSPLITATVFGKKEVAILLIDAGVDLSIKNNDGSTALHTAAFFCHPEVVMILLQKGADKSIKNNYGQTPYETVSGPFKEVKEFYLGLGAMLEPMGLKLDLDHIEKTRPHIASMLK